MLLFGSPLVADMSFEEWQQRDNQAFVNYQTQMEKEFVEMLKGEWKEYHRKRVIKHYDKPKPPQQPIYKPQPKPQEIIKVTPKPQKIEPLPTLPKKQEIAGFTKLRFDFFGIDIEILYNKKLKFEIDTISALNIANFWDRQSSNNHQSLIKEIKEYQESYNLDGWATYLLVREITNRVTSTANSQNLLQWFILLKLGVDVKVGFSSDSISLLVYNSRILYGFSSFIVNGKRYYNLNETNHTKLQIYRDDMSNLYALEFLDKQIKLPSNVKNREIRFSYKNRAYIFNIPYNQNLVKYYKNYPQLDYIEYRRVSKASQSFISQQLSPIIANMSEIDAINFLLRLTQNGFKYKRDDENFGKEKVLFFDETLAYEYSDCEDRAIFFSILIRELLHLDLVFIRYPNHLATAISLKSDIGGDSVIHNSKKYYIADPTYNNANIGKAMPQLKGHKIKILTIRN